MSTISWLPIEAEKNPEAGDTSTESLKRFPAAAGDMDDDADDGVADAQDKLDGQFGTRFPASKG